jgi:predicted PurR-regulated permease PerM
LPARSGRRRINDSQGSKMSSTDARADDAAAAGTVEDRALSGVYRLDFFGGRGRLLALGVAVLVVLWLARGIIGPFVVAAILAYAFSPVVSAVEDKTHAPRVLVVAAGYAIVLGLLAVLAVLVAERAGSEIDYLSSGGPDIIATALRKAFGDQIVVAGVTYNVNDIAAQIRGSLFGMIRTPTDAIHTAERAVEVALQTILTLIAAFYFLLDGRRFGVFAMRFLDRSQRAETLRIAHHIHVVLGRWLRGQLLLIGLVAAILYVVLGPILHVPYALAIAIFSGVLEIIPLVGPVIAAALAGTVAFATHGTDTTIVVLVVYLVVRQIEDQIVMPLVIGRAVHLHPVVTIFAVLVGLSVWGVLGGLLAVPVAAALNVTLHELYPDVSGRAEAATADRGRVRAATTRRLLRRYGEGGPGAAAPSPQARPVGPTGPAAEGAPAAPRTPHPDPPDPSPEPGS